MSSEKPLFSARTTCGECGETIPSPEANVDPCTTCGSKLRKLEIDVQRERLPHGGGFIVVVGDTTERDSTQAIRYRKSHFKKDDQTHHVYRVFDRLNNRYVEVIYEDGSGDVIRHVDEPLTEHRGRGDAKHKKR